jgi:PPM family protein phosphatase
VSDDLEFDAQTDKGMVRSENQDRTGVWVHQVPEAARENGRLFVVCDGMGGHNGGSVASATAVEALLASFRESTHRGVKRRLGYAIERANAAVRTKAAQDVTLRNMGTTCVALVLRGRRAQVAHIGDSRAYIFRGGRAEQITHDHTYLNDLIEIGLLTPERARNHPERNIITRCIGMSDALQVDFNSREVTTGDIFLLCTDGLYNYVEGDEMVKIVESLPPSEACETLLRLANSRGGEDNITCLVVKVNALDLEQPAELAEDATPMSPQRQASRISPDSYALATGGRGRLAGTDITDFVQRTIPLERRSWWRGWALVILAELLVLSVLIALKVML